MGNEADAKFKAYARTALPQALAIIRQLQTQLAEARAVIAKLRREVENIDGEDDIVFKGHVLKVIDTALAAQSADDAKRGEQKTDKSKPSHPSNDEGEKA
jgi:hypothetical protein